MLIASGTTFDLYFRWASGVVKRKAVPGLKDIKYPLVFLDMVQRTVKVIKIQRTYISYNPDVFNIFDMCHFGEESEQANCVLSSILEGCYFQDVLNYPPENIFVGLETATTNTVQYKSTSSLRNNNFAPPETRHPVEGRHATHWSSRIERRNGTVTVLRSNPKLEKCGPRNLNFADYGDYIAESIFYSQINTMTHRLKGVLKMSLAASKDMVVRAYVGTQLHGILFFLLRAILESKKTPLEELYRDYEANARRDAVVFGQKLPSAATTRQLFQTFYTGINDELVALALSDEK